MQGGRNRGNHYNHIYSSINMDSSLLSDKDSTSPPPPPRHLSTSEIIATTNVSANSRASSPFHHPSPPPSLLDLLHYHQHIVTRNAGSFICYSNRFRSLHTQLKIRRINYYLVTSQKRNQQKQIVNAKKKQTSF